MSALPLSHAAEPLPHAAAIAHLAPCLAAAAAGDGCCEAAVRAGLALRNETAADDDVSFFLVAWGVERMAAQRAEAGDLAIDEVAARLRRIEAEHDLTPERQIRGEVPPEWRAAREEYAALMDALVADTFDELREFEMAKLYDVDRATYRRRRAAGRAEMARLLGRELPMLR